jgi:hypothetical protein
MKGLVNTESNTRLFGEGSPGAGAARRDLTAPGDAVA